MNTNCWKLECKRYPFHWWWNVWPFFLFFFCWFHVPLDLLSEFWKFFFIFPTTMSSCNKCNNIFNPTCNNNRIWCISHGSVYELRFVILPSNIEFLYFTWIIMILLSRQLITMHRSMQWLEWTPLLVPMSWPQIN